MINKELINLVAEKTKIANNSLIEKDLILHKILGELELNKYFSENYVFKGGTCLIKCFLDYYRFSEDLDFTFLNQNIINNKTKNQIEKILSAEINKLIGAVKPISNKIGLDFKAEKKDERYLQFGNSNRFVTLKLWYKPENGDETFIKIQVNFIEKLEFPVAFRKINSIFSNQNSDIFLPENEKWLVKIPKLKCYDIKEVLIEKARAILTRRGIKARDFIDIYMIEKANNIQLEDFKAQIADKVTAMLKYEKYKTNLDSKINFIPDKIEQEEVMLKPIPKDFDAFLKRLNLLLIEVKDKIKTN